MISREIRIFIDDLLLGGSEIGEEDTDGSAEEGDRVSDSGDETAGDA